jgi:hypothetical protein
LVICLSKKKAIFSFSEQMSRSSNPPNFFSKFEFSIRPTASSWPCFHQYPASAAIISICF